MPNTTPRDEQSAGPSQSEARSFSIDGGALDQVQLTGGELNAAITSALVGIHTEFLGRGPRRASTFHHGNVLVTLMHDVLTPAEKSLMRTRHTDAVEQIRLLFHETMEDEFREAVERLTGRKVLACISGNHLEPDVAAVLFILDGPLWAKALRADEKP